MANARRKQKVPRPERDQARAANVFFGSRTDIGRVRERNEDSLIVNPPLFAVADGMGGHEAGDVASEVAIASLAANAPKRANASALGKAVEIANAAVLAEAVKRGHEGMGTTMTACVIEGDQLVLAHVGDSRAYLLHTGKLQQITRDHSLVADMVAEGRLTKEEARIHPNRSIITRALGSDPNMKPDLYEITASAGDRLLLCSDGLSSLVSDEDIQQTLARVADPQRCAAALVEAALEAGGTDNVTVVVVDIAGDGEKAVKRERRAGRAWMVLVMLALVGIVGGTLYGVNAYIHNVAYLIEQNGNVAIYQGIPEELAGVETHWFIRETDIAVSDLQPSAQHNLQTGIRLDNLDEAEKLVKEYEDQLKDKAEAEKSAKAKAERAKKQAEAAAAGNSADDDGDDAADPASQTGTAGNSSEDDGADAQSSEANGGNA